MSIKAKFRAVKTAITAITASVAYIKNLVIYSKKAITGDEPSEKYRVFILVLSGLFVFNYLAFCLNTNKNVFDIFPSIPPIEKKLVVTVYLPDSKAQTIIQEQRRIPIFEQKEKLLNHLFSLVVKGSETHENTSMIVPMPLFVRKIWIQGQQQKTCVYDIEPEILTSKSTVVKGSEALFRKALQQTVTKNIPSIKDVIILEKGVPNKALWEM